MPWSDAFSSLPAAIRGAVAVFTVVLTVIVVSYIALVVAPTVPAITEAVKQGRSFTLISLGIGEYEAPEVKNCKIIVENTNNSLQLLEKSLESSIDMLKYQQTITQDIMSKRSTFMQLPLGKTNSMSYLSGSNLEQLNLDVDYQMRAKDEIVTKVQ
jgi:sialic acid synthase SpsE